MASQLNNPPRPGMSRRAEASARQAAKVMSYVDLQLEKTRKQVKTIDLIAGILVLVAFTVGFLILVALVDAWILPLSTLGRWICLVLLIGGCLAYTFFAIVPLFLKRINPDYAAKMIEDAKPSFRNSLMNYVSLRKHPSQIKASVLDAVSRQAATDLASVPGDATVDQSKLIRLGFILIGLTLFVVGYKMLSPKDPLQTVARILAPAGKIAQPAIVKVEDVQPGDAKIFFGEQLQVTATIRGSHRPEDVRLVYSTLDGQLTEQSIPMQPDSTPDQYSAELSMMGGGIQSSLSYRVVAKDGSSPDYEVIVRPNPSIAVESLVFDAPPYAKIAQRTLTGIGDVEAIVGTKVTVHAIANLPIKVASIELLNEVSDSNRPLGDNSYESRYKAAAPKITMQSDGNSAIGRFPVALNSSGERPFASHYRLHFVSTDGDPNVQPNVYPIRVIPDLAPEIEFRNPVQPNVEIPINGGLAIDVLASDLDFEISYVSLNIDHQGKNLIAQKLKLVSDDGNRRVTASYQLRPSELGLKVGDRAVFFASAGDNRISHSSELPDPNISRTQNYSVIVTEWDQKTEEQNQKAKTDQAKQNPENAENNSDDEDKQNQSNQDQSGDDSTDSGDSGDESEGGKNGNKQGADKGQDGDSDNPGSESGESSKDNQGDSQGKGEGRGSTDEQQSGDPGQDQTGDKSEGQGSGESAQDQKNESSEQETSNGSQDSKGSGDSSGSKKDQPSGDGGEPSDGQAESNDSSAGDQTSGESQTPDGAQGGQQDQPSGNNSPDDMPSEEADGQKDDELTDGSQEKISRNASDGERMKKLQELLDDDQEGDESSDDAPSDLETDDENKSTNPSDANDSAGDEPSRTGDDSQPPSENPSSSGDASQDTGDPTQNPNQPPEDLKNQPGSESNDDSDADKNRDKGSATEQKPGNESSADGQKNQNGGNEQADPRTDKKGETAEDSNNNDSPREQSSKTGMDDATGKQSQDPGGEETEKTGNESGGTDPGQSDSDGNESGKSEPGKPENSDSEQTKPDRGGKPDQNSSEGGKKPGSEGQQEMESDEQGNTGEANPEEGGQSGSGKPGQSESAEKQSSESGEQSESGTKSDKPEGGKPAEGDQSQPSAGSDAQKSNSKGGGTGGAGGTTGELLEKEKTNFEHAKKATDMVLKKLSDQRYNPDPELLDKMNWTQQDMENFLRRWEEMKRAAELGNPADKKKYEKSLKSLGLRAPGGRRTAKELNETAEGLSEDSAVNRPPPERVPDYNSFLKDLNRANDN